jgi:hypothetical protein
MGSVYGEGYALVVGVGADLPNTVNDAIGLAKILADKDRCAYPESQVSLLPGPQATRGNILTELDKLNGRVTAESRVVIYFSGHGYAVTSAAGQVYYLMPFGYDTKQLSQTAISGGEFTDKLRTLPVKQLLVLLDCCHAGGFEEAKAPGLQLSKAPLPPEAGELFAKGSGRVLIASSKATELSFAGKPYSAFTVALIEALCGKGAAKEDGYVRSMDLALHTRQVVPQRTKDKQHPIVDLERADNFIVGYYAGGERQAKGLPFESEPEVEPEPGAWKFDQQGQVVSGPETNIAGGVHGPVLSGTFQGPVRVGGQDTHTTLFDNRDWKVGHVNQIAGNMYVDVGSAAAGTRAPAESLENIFAHMQESLKRLPQEDQEEVAPILNRARKLAGKIQRGEGSAEDESRLEERLRLLLLAAPAPAQEGLERLSNPASGVAAAIQEIALRARRVPK